MPLIKHIYLRLGMMHSMIREGFGLLDRALLAGQLEWNMPLLIFIMGIAILNVLFIKRLSYEKKTYQLSIFLIALSLFYIVVGSPLSTISHLSFSLHMIQMSILYFFVPPLLLLGIPKNLTSVLNRKSSVFFLSFTALVVFSLLFLTYHFPPMLTIFSQNPFIHNAYTLLLFLLSLLMWHPIASIDPEPHFNIEQKRRYATWNSILIMPACLFFIVYAFMDGMNNPFHSQLTAYLCLPPQSSYEILPSPFNTKLDQILAGLIMLGLHKFSIIMTFHLEKIVVFKAHQ